jgi:hypothetical protein
MITRVTWFVAGAAAGAVGATYTRRKVKRVADQLTPANVARSVAGRAKARGLDIVDALREGRAAMRVREEELRAERDATSEGTGLAIGGNPRADHRAVRCAPTRAARPGGDEAEPGGARVGRPPIGRPPLDRPARWSPPASPLPSLSGTHPGGATTRR